LVPPDVSIRPMMMADLSAIDRWLRAPHVARWFLPETTAEAEVEKYRQRIDEPLSATTMCTVELERRPIGWCQWYRWEDYPDDALSIGALRGEVGADYAIGETSATGHGIGTAMIGTLVAEARRHHARAGLVITPEAGNCASRRALEKSGFSLVDVRPLVTEPHDRPVAIYRLFPA